MNEPRVWEDVWSVLAEGQSVTLLFRAARDSDDLAFRAGPILAWLSRSEWIRQTATEIEMANGAWFYARRPLKPATAALMPSHLVPKGMTWLVTDE